MRSRMAFAALLAVIVAMSCDQNVPTAAEQVTDAPGIMMDNGAIKWIPDEFCGVFDHNGDTVFPVDCRNQISTFSKHGNAKIVIHATLPNPTGETIRWDAYNPPRGMVEYFGGPPTPCWVYDTDGPDGPGLCTLNWSAKLTASGQASLVCNYSKNFATECNWQ